MNILYIADPTSIHDIRWINFFGAKDNIKCFILSRRTHLRNFDPVNNLLSKHVNVLSSITDPSTVRPWKNWWQAWRIRKIIVKNEIQLLHILYAEPNSLWANWKWLFGIPVIVTTRGTDILRTIPFFFEKATILSKIIAWRYRNALNTADRVTCTSGEQVLKLMSLRITTTATVVRTGVDFDLIGKGNESISITKQVKRSFILMPRNMRPVYNHEFTLGAIALLDRKVRDKYSFIFLNSETHEAKYFNTICGRAKTIDADIQFLPSLNHLDLLALYKRATLVVMNPRSDGSPVTAMEAMASKVPVILPPLAYDKELFEFAFIFDEWTEISLKNKIEEVLKLDDKAMERLRELNFQKVYENGNFEFEMRKLETIYSEVGAEILKSNLLSK